MRQLIINLYFWALDYIYVAKEQVLGILSRSKPDQYRTDDGRSIILIPGVYENWRFMRPVAKLLATHGFDVHIIDGLGYNRGTVEAMAKVVKQYITANELSDITIIAHSKGGLIGKYLLALFADQSTIRQLITLNTPFSGSFYAYFLPIRSLRIFTPHSKILTSLAHDELANSRIVSIYGQFDPHIPGGSKLEGAKNIQLSTYGHFRIMNDPDVHSTILDNIGTSGRTTTSESV